jgi:hypothetical protein
MIIFPRMLVEASIKAGIKVPEDPDKYDPKCFPHFDIFCKVQLCRSIRWGEHWENAEVVARIPESKLETITILDLIADGLSYQT